MDIFNVYLKSGQVIPIPAEDVKISYSALDQSITGYEFFGNEPSAFFRIDPSQVSAIVKITPRMRKYL